MLTRLEFCKHSLDVLKLRLEGASQFEGGQVESAGV